MIDFIYMKSIVISVFNVCQREFSFVFVFSTFLGHIRKDFARIAKAALQVTQLTCKFMFLKNNNTSEETLTKVLDNGADPQKDGDHRG